MYKIIINYIWLTLGLIIILLLMNYLLNNNKNDNEKLSPYECGFIPVLGQNRYRFEIVYYLIGLIFLAFDLEIGLLLPVVKIISEISYISYWIGSLFVLILTTGFVYEFKINAIKL